MKRKVSLFMFAIVFALFGLGQSVSAETVTYHPSLVHKKGAMAYEHMNYLAYEIGPRVAGSENERMAEQYIKSQFERMGFETTVQEFEFPRGGSTVKSSNVISYKPVKSDVELIVGAHYDSVS